MESRNRQTRFGTGRSLALVVALLLAVLPAGCSDTVTDCYEMRQVEGTRSNGEFCLCTFFYPAPDPPASDPHGPACRRDCRDGAGTKVEDCNAIAPF